MVYKGFTQWRSTFVKCKYSGEVQDSIKKALKNVGGVTLLDIQYVFDGSINLYGVQITYGFTKEKVDDGIIEKIR